MSFSQFLAASAVVLGLAGSSALANDAAQLIGVSAQDEGSVIVARGPEAGALVQQVGVDGYGVDEAVIITGKKVGFVTSAMAQLGAEVVTTTYGTSETRVLVLTNTIAIEFHRVLVYVYGPQAIARRGIAVLHGGMHHLADCLDAMVRGTLNLGVNIARLTFHTVACSAVVAWHFAENVVSLATCFVVRAASGAVMVVRCAAGHLLKVVRIAGHGTLHIASTAVWGVFRLTHGIWSTVTHWLRDLFTCPIGCASVVVYI